MFVRRENDQREGNWTVKAKSYFEPKSFKAPYAPQLYTVREAMKHGLGRVFHFHNLDFHFQNAALKGIWRAFLSADGQGCWQNLSRPARVGDLRSSPEFIFRLRQKPRNWAKLEARQWLEILGNELENPASDARFALDFAVLSRIEQENARLTMEKGTPDAFRRVFAWLMQTHKPFWESQITYLWELSADRDDWGYSGGFENNGDEIWEELNPPPILETWRKLVFGKTGARLDAKKIALHSCLEDSNCWIRYLVSLRVEPPSFHEKIEAMRGLKQWFEIYAPDELENFNF